MPPADYARPRRKKAREKVKRAARNLPRPDAATLQEDLKVAGRVNAKREKAREEAKAKARRHARVISGGATPSLAQATHKAFGITGPFQKRLTQSTNEATVRAQKRKLRQLATGERDPITAKVKLKPFGLGHHYLTKENAQAALGKAGAERYIKDERFRRAINLTIEGDDEGAKRVAPQDMRRKIEREERRVKLILKQSEEKAGHTKLGINVPTPVGKLLRTIGATEVNILKAGIADPKGQTGKTIRAVPEILKGIAGGVVGGGVALGELAISANPRDGKKISSPTAKRLWKDVRDDYSARYGDVWRNEPGAVKKQLDRMKKDGVLPYGIDVLSIAAPLAGGAVGAAARRGLLGRSAEQIMKAPRPMLRTSTGRPKHQRISTRFGRATLQRAQDDLRTRSLARAVGRAQTGKGKLHVLAGAVQEGEVAPLGATMKVSKAKLDPRKLARARVDRIAVKDLARSRGRDYLSAELERAESLGKDVGKRIRKLSGEEKQAFALATMIGLRSFSDIKTTLAAVAEKIRAKRAENPGAHIPDEADALPLIERLASLDEATLKQRFFTPRTDDTVRHTAAVARKKGLADPSMGATALAREERVRAREVEHQASVLGMSRITTEQLDELGQRLAEVTGDKDLASPRVVRDGRKVVMEEKRAAWADRVYAALDEINATEGANPRLGWSPKSVSRSSLSSPAARKDSSGRTLFEPGRGSIDKDGNLHTWNESDATHSEYWSARTDPNSLERGIRTRGGDFLIKADGTIDVHGTGGRLTELEIVAKAVAQDPRLKPSRRVKQDPAWPDALQRARREAAAPVERRIGESGTEFADRVVARAAELNLEPGAYFPGIKFPGDDPSAYTGATRGVAVQGHKRSAGTNFELGRMSLDPQLLTTAIARNIKIKHNWQSTANFVDDHVLLHLTDKKTGERIDLDPEGESLNSILTKLDRAGIDRSTVSLINTRKYASEIDELDPESDNFDADVESVLVETVIKPEGSLDHYRDQTGLTVIPRAVSTELDRLKEQPGGWGKFGAGQAAAQSTTILGLNPSWAQFQVVANTVTQLLADPSALLKWRANSKLYKSYSPEERQAFDVWAGTGPSRDFMDKPRIATTFNDQMIAMHQPVRDFLKRRLKDPLGLFAFDLKQTQAFRRNFLLNDLRKQSVLRIEGHVRDLVPLQDRVQAALRNPDDLDMQLNSRAAMEAAAAKVNDIMGDWTSYTAFERKYLKRIVPFYGYLRYSLRLTFYTMPVHHPVMAGILAQLGRIHVNEVKELLGPGVLPFQLGAFYAGKDGGTVFDFSRANPMTNLLTNLDFGGAGAFTRLSGATYPLLGAVIEAMADKDLFTNRDFSITKPNGAREFLKEYEKLHGTQGIARFRIFADKMLSTAAPYRIATKHLVPGTATSESLLWDPKVPEEWDPKIVLSKERQAAVKPDLGGLLARELIPGFPRPAREAKDMARRRAEMLHELRLKNIRQDLTRKDPRERAKLLMKTAMERALTDPETGERLKTARELLDEMYLERGILPPGGR